MCHIFVVVWRCVLLENKILLSFVAVYIVLSDKNNHFVHLSGYPFAM